MSNKIIPCDSKQCINGACVKITCFKEGQSLGAIVPGNFNNKCCTGLVAYVPPGVLGTMGTCMNISNIPKPVNTNVTPAVNISNTSKPVNTSNVTQQVNTTGTTTQAQPTPGTQQPAGQTGAQATAQPTETLSPTDIKSAEATLHKIKNVIIILKTISVIFLLLILR